MPSRERLRRDPDREAAALLERPVVLRPVADLVARPGDLVAARFIGLVGHRSSGERGSGPIRPTVALPKPQGSNFAPTPWRSTNYLSPPEQGGSASGGPHDPEDPQSQAAPSR